ncbi:MAG: RNA methyltransferase [Ignavibacteriales bacterium]|nr:RNA methyltransferase [Ignavibacteriales bacterium]MCB9259321.1 RNA methyltransferase [Ignavibacteriales bacterium]
MRKFKTERRLKKIEKVAAARQFSLRVVLENIHDPHNVSAIFRSCDAVGIPQVDLLYNVEKFPKISRVSSASSKKWVEQKKFEKVDNCITNLKQEGFKIYGSILSEDAENIYDLDLTEKVAIVMGNEHRGISEEMIDAVDKHIYIPMRGMIQSLNVSVATAVILYEAQRQRALKGMYSKSELKKEELEELINIWCDK